MTRIAALCAVILAACVNLEEIPAGWESAELIEGPLRPELARNPREARSSQRLRVVSYNVATAADTGALIAALGHPALEQADVFLFQEIESHPSEETSRAGQIASALGMAYFYAPAREQDEGTHGLAILSRLPLSNPRVMELPDHQTSVRDRRRIAQAVAVEVSGATLELVNVHLDLRLGVAERVAQLRPATQGHDGAVVLGGDLNTNPYAWVDVVPVPVTEPVSNLDVAGVVDEFMRKRGYSTPTAEAGVTQRSSAGQFRLDALYSRNVTNQQALVLRDIDLSDHWPVMLDIVMR